VAFEPEDSEGYVAFLRQHGFCVVHVLTDEVSLLLPYALSVCRASAVCLCVCVCVCVCVVLLLCAFDPHVMWRTTRSARRRSERCSKKRNAISMAHKRRAAFAWTIHARGRPSTGRIRVRTYHASPHKAESLLSHALRAWLDGRQVPVPRSGVRAAGL
jgi:hypothetical protein